MKSSVANNGFALGGMTCRLGTDLLKLLMFFVLITICLPAIGQTSPMKKDSWPFTKKNDEREALNLKPLTFYPGTYIDTEYRHTDSSGITVIIQNSKRKGGGYTDLTGKRFFSAIYWYRVINETSTPIELTIHFPAHSFATLPSPDSYLKVFIPLDTMELGKEMLYNYGATGLKSFLDAGLNKPTRLQRTIHPNEAILFYVGVLYYKAVTPTQVKLELKGQEVFYKIGGLEIPCGRIVVMK